MTNNVISENLKVSYGDTASIDAFARLRVSSPSTLFDSKQLHDSLPRRWDDSEVSGSGTSSAYNTDQSSTTISVSASTAGKRIRQTFMRFNYQPGKSQLILMTGVIRSSGGGSGINTAIGQFDDENGLFFKDAEGVLQVGVRSYVTGSAVDTTTNQASWNVDTMDGAGPSAVTIDPEKPQIFIIDYEWLGVGRVRFGFVIDGIPVYCHELLNANSALDTVYMTTPNNPLRYEIENDGSGAASSIDQICCSVISEGGQQDTGVLNYHSTGGTHVNANTAGAIYAIIGIRLKTTHLDAIVKEVSSSLLSKTNDDFEWLLILNPSVAGVFTYADQANSAVQTALGATANTVTGGHILTGGFASQTQSAQNIIPNSLWLGADIAGNVDEVVLCARPMTSNADIEGGITWRELT